MYQREFHKRSKTLIPICEINIWSQAYLPVKISWSICPTKFYLSNIFFSLFFFVFCFLFLFLVFCFSQKRFALFANKWWLLKNLGNGRHDHKSGVICNGLNSHPVGNASLQFAFQLGIRHSMPSFISSTPTFELAREAPLLLWLDPHCPWTIPLIFTVGPKSMNIFSLQTVQNYYSWKNIGPHTLQVSSCVCTGLGHCRRSSVNYVLFSSELL